MNTTEKNSKSCLSCGEDILAEARRCPYCGSLQNTAPRAEEQLPLQAEPVEEAVEAAALEISHSQEIKTDIQYIASPKANPDLKKLGNGMKAFILTICTIIPGFGQIAGIIVSIIFMNSGDNDRKSFGKALLIAMLMVFVLSCVFYIVVAMLLVSARDVIR